MNLQPAVSAVQSFLQTFMQSLQSWVQTVPPPSPFLDGLLAGVLIGLVLATLILGRNALGAFLRHSLRGAAVLAPAVLACLLWGAWIGILAAKGLVP